MLGLPTQTFFKWQRWPVCRRDLEDAYVTNAAVDPYRGDPEFGYRHFVDDLKTRSCQPAPRVSTPFPAALVVTTRETRLVTLPLAVIGVPTAGAHHAGQDLAPAALRARGFVDKLVDAGVAVTDAGDVVGEVFVPDDVAATARNMDAVVAVALAVADAVEHEFRAGRMPIGLRDARSGQLLASLALDDQDPRLRYRVGHVFVADLGVAHTAGREPLNLFLSGVSVVHVNCAIEDHENLRSIVDVPVVGLVGPMQPDSRVLDLGDVQGTPRTVGGEPGSIEEAHSWMLPEQRNRGEGGPGDDRRAFVLRRTVLTLRSLAATRRFP